MSVLESEPQARTLEIIDCGLANYRQILQRQEELREKRGQELIGDTVLLVEHQPVITFGARQSANRLLIDADELAERNIDVVQIRRGGGTTAHNPGQLVFYPILNLKEQGLGINEYIRTLEQIGIELLAELGVDAKRRKGYPGLWVQGARKIASIGVRVSKFITHHGMAVNINNELDIFDYIVPCGLEGVEMTSVLRESGRQMSMAEVKEKLQELLCKHLNSRKLNAEHRIMNVEYKRKNIEHRTLNAERRTQNQRSRLPAWLKRPIGSGQTFTRTSSVLENLGLQTICNDANCPNRGECWSRGTATVLILGNICTRNCRFCSVAAGKPEPPDASEPGRLAKMAERMSLKYLVITSVDRDDLPDGGARHFRDCISAVRAALLGMKFEILVPDFRHCQREAIDILKGVLPFVFAHNIETVPSLYPLARPGGDYKMSLNLLRLAKESFDDTQTKSSIMLGLGEIEAEVEQVLSDLRGVGCERITIGQYLKPSRDSLEVAEYITPEKFEFWKQRAYQLGFSWVICEPFARSSYFAEKEATAETLV